MALYNRPSISSKKSQPQPCDNTRAILRSQEIREGGCKSSFPSTTQDQPSSHHSLLLRTLKLDASEPWERSLLCSLKDRTFNKSVRNPGQHDVMLLQHTESRDQALKMDDEDDQSLLSAYGVTGVTAPSLRNSIYRTTPTYHPETSLLDQSETLSVSTTNSYYKVVRGTIVCSTMSSVTAPDCYDEDRGDQNEERRSTGHVRHASDSGVLPTSLRCGHCRRMSAPITRASDISDRQHANCNDNDHGEYPDDCDSLNGMPNSILASIASESSACSSHLGLGAFGLWSLTKVKDVVHF